MRVHEDKKPIKCSLCDEKFPLKSSSTTNINEGKKPFKYTFCNHKNAQKVALNNHILAIHGEKQFKYSL